MSVGLPARLRLGPGLLEVNLLVHVIDPGKRNEMMLARAVRVVLGQLHLIPPLEMIHGADVDTVGTEDFHVFLDHRRCDHMCSSVDLEEKPWPAGGVPA